MKRNYKYIISVFGLLFLSSLTADCVEIVYPKSKDVVINSESTFFIGNENPAYNLTVNSEPVKLNIDGAFLHPVKLNLGENLFILDNGKDTRQVYKITRGQNVVKQGLGKEVLYKTSSLFVSAKDNVSLRSTPYDCGINRLQHFEKGIPLKVIGEFDDFYKVQLARDDYAWILKGDVIKSDKTSEILAKIESFEYSETPNKRVFTLKLTDKVPYVLSEATNGFDLVVYNVKGYPENKYEFHIYIQ